jgi:hypothetical protein
MNPSFNYSAPPIGTTVGCLQGPIPSALPCGLVIQVAPGSPAKVVPRVGIVFDSAEILYAFPNSAGGPGSGYLGAAGAGTPLAAPGPQSWILSTSRVAGSPQTFSWQGSPLIIPYVAGGYRHGDGEHSGVARVGNLIIVPAGEILLIVLGGASPVLEGLCMYSWAVKQFNIQAM